MCLFVRKRCFECFSSEQELSLRLKFCCSFRMYAWLTYPFTVVVFLLFLESLSWNRKSDALFTGLSPWEASGGVRLRSLNLLNFCFDLPSLQTCSHHLSTVACSVEILTPQLLCLDTVTKGLFFLLLFSCSIIVSSCSFFLYLRQM